MLLMDQEFEKSDCLKRCTNEKMHASLNPTSAREHVPEIERRICTVKERVRETVARLPCREKLPRVMVMEIANNCVLMLDSFPSKGGVSNSVSPMTMMTGQRLDAKKHLKLPVGDCAQTHEDFDRKNDNGE